MTDKIPKHLEDRNDWSVEDHISYAKTGELPINPEWERRRREAMEDAGVEIEVDRSEKPIDEWTVQDHADEITRLDAPGEYQ